MIAKGGYKCPKPEEDIAKVSILISFIRKQSIKSSQHTFRAARTNTVDTDQDYVIWNLENGKTIFFSWYFEIEHVTFSQNPYKKFVVGWERCLNCLEKSKQQRAFLIGTINLIVNCFHIFNWELVYKLCRLYFVLFVRSVLKNISVQHILKTFRFEYFKTSKTNQVAELTEKIHSSGFPELTKKK